VSVVKAKTPLQTEVHAEIPFCSRPTNRKGMRMGRTLLLLASVAAAMLLAIAVGLFGPVGSAEAAEVTDSSTQVEEVDLTITTKADAPEVDVGEELTYEITVANNEPTATEPVSGLIITDLLPGNVDLIGVDEGENTDDCSTTNDDEVRCRLASLWPGEEAVLFITIAPQEDADEELENVAELLLNRTLIDDDEAFTDVNGGDGGPVQ
jgi:uncharacterized repeat protein (TIGR01451 family)